MKLTQLTLKSTCEHRILIKKTKADPVPVFVFPNPEDTLAEVTPEYLALEESIAELIWKPYKNVNYIQTHFDVITVREGKEMTLDDLIMLNKLYPHNELTEKADYIFIEFTNKEK